MRRQPFKAILLFARIHRFGDAVAVKNKARTRGQTYLTLRIISALQTEVQAALHVQETRPAVAVHKRAQMPGIRKGHRARLSATPYPAQRPQSSPPTPIP